MHCLPSYEALGIRKFGNSNKVAKQSPISSPHKIRGNSPVPARVCEIEGVAISMEPRGPRACSLLPLWWFLLINYRAVLPWGEGGGEVAIRTSRTTKAMPRETSLVEKEFKPKHSFYIYFIIYIYSFYSFNLLPNCPWSWIHEDCFQVQTKVKKKINKHVHVILLYCAFLALY